MNGNNIMLRKWQKEFVKWGKQRWLKNNNGLYLNADVGAGKTIGALALLKELKYKDIAVIAPLSAHESWKKDGALMGLEFELNKNLFTYEKVARNNIITECDCLILDEAHRIKNPSAKITKLILKYYTHIPKLLLSGTPQDKLHELYSQYKAIKDDIFGGLSWSKFINKYFFLDTYFKPIRLKDERYKDEILNEIEPLTFRVRLQDIVELRGLEIIDITLKPSEKIKKKIKKYKDEALNPVTTFIKEYEIGQGIDPDTKEIFEKTKIEWVLDFIKDNPNTIVFSYFKPVIEFIKAKLKDKAYYITGDDKKDLKSVIEKADKPIFATYALKEGANLQKYNKVVYMSLPLSYRDYYQSRGRVYRSGQEKKVVVYHLYQNAIDYEVGHILAAKKDLNEYVKNRIFKGVER